MANYFYEYVWDIIFNIPSRKISFRPYCLTEFSKKCDYFNSFIPNYHMVCKIHDRDLNLLRTLDKEMKVTVKQYMFYGTDRNNMNERALIFEDTFAAYYDKEQIPNYTAASKSTTTDITDTSKDQYLPGEPAELSNATIDFNLLLITDLKMKTYIHNYVLGDEKNPVSPITAVKLIVSENPYITKCIIDKPENNNKYTDLIVEPAELKNAIKNIQYRYGLYSKSLLLFYDNGILYILNKFEHYHSYACCENTMINVKIEERVSNVNPIDCATIDDNGKYIGYERVGKIHKQDFESIDGVLRGDKFIYSNYDAVMNTGFGQDGQTTFNNTLKEIGKPRLSRQDVGEKQIVDYDMLNNPFNMSSIMYEQSPGVTIGFSLASVNCNHFNPVKNIKLTVDTPESKKLYSGIYNIASVEFVYTNLGRPNTRFRTFGHVGLVLVNKTEGFDKEYLPDVVDKKK